MLPGSFICIVLLLVANTIDGRYRFRESQLRGFWDAVKDKLKSNAVNNFHIDIRHFDREEMILFPDVAFQAKGDDSKWNVMLHGWRYEGNRGKDWLGYKLTRLTEKLVRKILGSEALIALNGSLNRDRLKPFFVENEPNELIKVQIGNKTHEFYTAEDGKFSEQIEVSNDVIQALKKEQQSKGAIIYEALGDNNDKAKGLIHLIEPRQGISVISDIDDTIKVSEVLDKIRLLANTFIHPFKPVDGMADLYQKWYTKNNNCTFHYLSGMPDQLYTLTYEFILANNFPDGSYHMRHFGWAAASLFDFLHSESTFTHKLKYLKFFISNTIRDFVLVGDSGEKDPEIYGTIAREYPDRIRAIFIRAIKGEAFDDERFQTAFQGVSAEKWQVFNDPKQLPNDLSRAPKDAPKSKRFHFYDLFD